MAGNNGNTTLNEAAGQFLTSLKSGDSAASQQETYRFVRWFGKDRTLDDIRPAEIENYAEKLSVSDKDYQNKFGILKKFLAYARKQGLSETNLGVHLKARKAKAKSGVAVSKAGPEPVPMSKQGYEQLKAEIESLKNDRHKAIDEIRKAAADKDFRENAPLHAARERRGYLEGRILELEATLRAAVVMDNSRKSELKVSLGDSVVLLDARSGSELKYMLVSPREVNVAQGKISNASPIGQALMGKKQGDKVEIKAPVGKLTYQIKSVER